MSIMDVIELDEAGNVVSEFKLKASGAPNEQVASVAIKVNCLNSSKKRSLVFWGGYDSVRLDT